MKTAWFGLFHFIIIATIIFNKEGQVPCTKNRSSIIDYLFYYYTNLLVQEDTVGEHNNNTKLQ
jgi:hypothetical protein